MPKLEDVVNTGTEWLFHLLKTCSDNEKLALMMTLWRIWHCRNEVLHHKADAAHSIEASAMFPGKLH
jgi:hypothetical protein